MQGAPELADAGQGGVDDQMQRQGVGHQLLHGQIKGHTHARFVAFFLDLDGQPRQNHQTGQIGRAQGVAQAGTGGQQGFELGQGLEREGVTQDQREVLIRRQGNALLQQGDELQR